MTPPLTLLLSLGEGFLLGALFFTGLWFTVRLLPRSSRPLLLMLGSSMLRVVVALLLFGWIAAGDWRRLGAALLGFLLARTFLLLRWRPVIHATEAALEEKPCS